MSKVNDAATRGGENQPDGLKLEDRRGLITLLAHGAGEYDGLSAAWDETRLGDGPSCVGYMAHALAVELMATSIQVEELTAEVRTLRDVVEFLGAFVRGVVHEDHDYAVEGWPAEKVELCNGLARWGEAVRKGAGVVGVAS